MISSVEKLSSFQECAELENTLVGIAERILEQNERRRRVAEALQKLKGRIDLTRVDESEVKEVMEPSFIKAVERDGLENVVVAGIDGGVLSQQLHGLDLILVRAVAAIFHYSGGELSAAEYSPGSVPSPRLISATEPLDARELELIIGVERQLAELKLAVQALRTKSPDVLLLDGSIVSQYVDRFSHGSRLTKLYGKLMDAFSELYRSCTETGVPLAGVVKDSRSARFIDIFRRKVLPSLEGGLPSDEALTFSKNMEILNNSRDTVLLDHVLNVGERSFTFSYAGNPASALRDLDGWGSKIFAFYLKTVPYDRPLRVEFLDLNVGQSRIADRIASLVYALSAHHAAFGLPSVLIEADVCARLSEEDLDMVRDSITARLGPFAPMDLRRHMIPF
ncbi:MAG: hypothetical protein AVW06_02335 [Hadesarchaea archaeon DG-33-1]|nr:MAG: hypothetical protein AVW06_02335 [Hadesarchaea archaeon DG-33-1]